MIVIIQGEFGARGNEDLIEVRKLYNSNQLLHCVGTDRMGIASTVLLLSGFLHSPEGTLAIQHKMRLDLSFLRRFGLN